MIKVKEYTVDPPFHALPGDKVERDGTAAYLKRNGATVATSVAGTPVNLESGDVTTKRVISSIFEAEEITMGLLQILDVTHNPSGTKTVHFPGGNSTEYGIGDLDAAADEAETPEFLFKIMAARWRNRSPTYASDESITNKMIEHLPATEFGNPISIGDIP